LSVHAQRDVYLAGFEITGDDPHAFVQEQRLDRPGFGDSTLRQDPIDLHVDDWQLRAGSRGSQHLAVHGDGGAIELTLRGRPDVIPIMAGRERSAALATSGILSIDGRRHVVHGIATIERIAGGDIDAARADWSWFDVNFDDGRSLVVNERRDAADRTESIAAAAQDRSGRATPLSPAAIDVSEWGRCAWISPSTGVPYPTVWDITLRGRRLVLQATVREQEVVPSIGGPPLWEGAANVIDADTDARIGWAIVTMRGIGPHPLSCGG